MTPELMTTQPCELCLANGITKVISPSQLKAHKMRMHPETMRNAVPQGPPAVVTVEPQSQSEPVPAPKRRGRPPKHGVAMTAAERKAVSRANHKEKQQDVERRNLVAEILIIARRNISKPGGETITVLGEDRILASNRQYLQTLREHLLHESVDSLRKSLEALKSSDLQGRLHNERSGEGERSMGQSEMERILAARHHDTSLFEFENDEDAAKEAKQMAAGFRVKPQGAGPDSEEDDDEDGGSSSVPDWIPTAEEKWLREAINSIISKLDLSFDSDGAQCPFCDQMFLVTGSAINHLEEQYQKDGRIYNKWQSMTSSLLHIHYKGGPLVTPDPPPTIPHAQGIEKEIDLIRKAARKKGNRRIS